MQKRSRVMHSILATCILSSASAFLPVANAQTKNPSTFSAIRVKDVPMKGGELGNIGLVNVQAKGNPIQSLSTISISSYNLSESDVISLQGHVLNDDGTVIPFNLSGALCKDPIGGRIDGSLQDGLGNYKVVRFQIVTEPSKGVFFTPKARAAHEAYLALYLEREGTRDLTFFEAPAKDVLGEANFSDIVNQKDSLPTSPDNLTFWIQRLFAPDSVERGSGAIPKFSRPGQVMNAAVSPMTTATPLYNYPYFQTTYMVAGYSVKDTIELEEKVSYPTQTSAGTITGRLGVWYTDYYENDGTDLDGTNWRVGYKGPVGIKLTTQDGSSQRVQWEQLAGQLEQSSSWTVNASLSMSYYGPSLTLQYNPASRVQLGSGGNVDCNGGYIGDAYTDSGQYLNYAGNPIGNAGQDYFSVNWQAPQYSQYGGPQNVTDRVDFIYEMYNFMEDSGHGNGTDHGSYMDTINLQTYANIVSKYWGFLGLGSNFRRIRFTCCEALPFHRQPSTHNSKYSQSVLVCQACQQGIGELGIV